MIRTVAIAAGTALVLLVGVTAFVALRGPDGEDRFAQCRDSRIAGGTDTIGGPFTLVDAQGRTVTDADVITKPSLLYFGYTFCPDICPFDMARNAMATEVLEDRGHDVTPVFISIDPKRDTPEVVGNFAANMSEKAIGLTGAPEQIRAASQAYKTYYKANDPGDDPYYLVDHSTFTYLVLPGHGFVEFFRRDLSAEDMASKVTCFIEAS
ncbi:MAG: SCO family protein [Qingshengfaniella sp.]